MKLLVVGAGYVGGYAAMLAERIGWQVTCVRRSLPAVKDQASLKHVAHDVKLAFPKSLRAQQWGSVIYSVAPSGRTEEGYRLAYEQGFRRALDELTADRVVLTSSTSALGEAEGEFVDDDAPAAPNTWRGQIVAESEQMAIDTGAYVARLAGIYGPGRNRQIRQVSAGEAVLVKGRQHYTNRIHQHDAARALIHILQRPSQPQPSDKQPSEPQQKGRLQLSNDQVDRQVAAIYNVCDGVHPTRNALLAFLANQMNAPAPATIAASPEQLGPRNKRVIPGRLRRSGFVWKYESFEAGYCELLMRDPNVT